MKELSIEQKARAYDEALERIRKELQKCGYTVCDTARQIYKFFPTLKESEDERIRNEIIKFLELPHPQFVGKRHQEEWIAWLEKQGEQKQDVSIQINPSDYINDMGGNGCCLKNATQASAWSKEDNYNVQCLIAKVTYDIQKGNIGRNQELIDWLKSLKYRMNNV